jgi:RNA polymerase sigma-70 factor (ECF subfamily)
LDALPAETSRSRDDAALVVAARSGDIAAFEQLVTRYTGMVFAVAYTRTADRDSAEDIVQEAFLRAYTGLHTLSEPRYFATWLSRIARNLATDWQRTGQRRSRALGLLPLDEVTEMSDPRAADVAEQYDVRRSEDALARSLARLSDEQREIVLLHFAEDWSLTEISRKLNVHRTTVGRHLELALAALRTDIAPLLRESCKAARVRPGLPAKAAAAVLVFHGLPHKARASVVSHFAAVSKGAASAAKAAAGASTVSAGTSGAGAAGILNISTAATAAGGKVIMTKTAITGVAVAAGLGVAGMYARPRLAPYFSSVARPASPRPDMQALSRLAASIPAGSVSIKPSTTRQTAGSMGRGEWLFTNCDLQNAINNAFEGYGPACILYEGLDRTAGAFDIAIKAPVGHPEQVQEMAQREIPKAYGVKVTPQEREMDVLVLRAPNGQGQLKPGTGNEGGSRLNGKAATFKGVGMDAIVGTLAGNLKIPIIDETGLTGHYDATVTADLKSKDAVIDAVRKQLGLELVPDHRKMKVLVVEKAG